MPINRLGASSRWLTGGIVMLAGALLSTCGPSAALQPTSVAPTSPSPCDKRGRAS